MAGIEGRKAFNDGMQDWLWGLEKNMRSSVQEAALDAGTRGQAMMEHTIDTTESALSPGKPNRNWTFNMRNSMDAKVEQRGTTITVSIGWLQNHEDYFLIQEYGGDLGNRHISAMHSLMAGHDEMLKTLNRWGVK